MAGPWLAGARRGAPPRSFLRRFFAPPRRPTRAARRWRAAVQRARPRERVGCCSGALLQRCEAATPRRCTAEPEPRPLDAASHRPSPALFAVQRPPLRLPPPMPPRLLHPICARCASKARSSDLRMRKRVALSSLRNGNRFAGGVACCRRHRSAPPPPQTCALARAWLFPRLRLLVPRFASRSARCVWRVQPGYAPVRVSDCARHAPSAADPAQGLEALGTCVSRYGGQAWLRVGTRSSRSARYYSSYIWLEPAFRTFVCSGAWGSCKFCCLCFCARHCCHAAWRALYHRQACNVPLRRCCFCRVVRLTVLLASPAFPTQRCVGTPVPRRAAAGARLAGL